MHKHKEVCTDAQKYLNVPNMLKSTFQGGKERRNKIVPNIVDTSHSHLQFKSYLGLVNVKFIED